MELKLDYAFVFTYQKERSERLVTYKNQRKF